MEDMGGIKSERQGQSPVVPNALLVMALWETVEDALKEWIKLD